ncbi:MAG TPA: hypothetical protein VFI70_04215 [Nitrososphaeraceae archaeon]|nr:hypothetical protein [Nitrososphaeraceae archaeon]
MGDNYNYNYSYNNKKCEGKAVAATTVTAAASAAKTTAPKTISSSPTKTVAKNKKEEDDFLLVQRKIELATEGFATKGHQILFSDRTRISKENALTICEYIIAMKREVNPRISYRKYTIQFLSELSKTVGIEKPFQEMTRDDVLCYLDKCRKPENEDPLHKWIGSYDTKLIVLSRFFKWLCYHHLQHQ